MASQQQVRQYLAYWFQLGKHVILKNGHESILPQPVIAGDRYSDAFEACWQRVLSPESGECYLEGTDQSINELLSSAWEMEGCARCAMPVPVPSRGMPALTCPCYDLPFWPDTDKPAPRAPISSADRMVQIRDRLQSSAHRTSSTSEASDQN